jgi:hypothetical protein
MKMIDYVKGFVPIQSCSKAVDQVPWIGRHFVHSGEVFGIHEHSQRGLRLRRTDKGILISGSLHKYKNFGAHNHCQFTYSEMRLSLNHIQQTTGLDLTDILLKNLELGVNIDLEVQPEAVLKNLLVIRGVPYLWGKIRGKGHFREAQFQRHSIKVYDKSTQYGLDSNILRFEKKFVKMNTLKAEGIVTFSDLLDRNKVEPFGLQELASAWSNSILIDPYAANLISANAITSNELESLSNQTAWVNCNKSRRRALKGQNEEIKDQLKESVHLKVLDQIRNIWTHLNCH